MTPDESAAVEGDDLPTEQDVAAVQPFTREPFSENGAEHDIEKAAHEGEQTQRKVMAAKAESVAAGLENDLHQYATDAREIAAYLAQQAE